MRHKICCATVLRRHDVAPLVLLAVLLVGGCATTTELRPSSISTRETPPADSVACSRGEGRSGQSFERSMSVRPVSYDDGVASSPSTSEISSNRVDTEGQALAFEEQPELDGGDVPDPPDGLTGLQGTALDDAETIEQPIEHFVAIAVSAHPKILAARHRFAAASNVIPQARALPDPKFNNIFWPIHDQALQTAGGRMGHQFQLSQGVPWPEKLRAKAAIASREVQMAQAELDRIEREITESVKLAYYEVWFATKAISIIEETRELINDLTNVAEARYKSGGTQQDVLRAQLESDRLDDKLVELRKQKAQAQADLAALVQQPVMLIPETLDSIDVNHGRHQLDELLALAEQCSPELRALAWEIQRDRQKQRLACLEKYPDFNVGLNYGIVDDNRTVISPVANGHDNLSFMVGVTLPIWREKINAGIREAAHRRNSSSYRLEAERDAIQGKLRRLIAQADALIEQHDIYEQRIIPRTEDTLKLSMADYRGKRTDFFALVETYRELLMFETQQARIEATLAGTIAQIERTVGCPE